ncbi:MAG: hypothetical protein JST09_09800 [Bacteroidetes bacterium]|nr:hypothetical protein [Bacteroidota bacterium]
MKVFFILGVILLSILSKDGCHKNKNTSFKGRLEVKGVCMNYTIKVLEGEIDKSLIEEKWADETTGKFYTNVFALGSRCTFPSSISQGEEFTFVIDTARVQNCAVCLAYYPTPSKHLSIKVLDK